jgi:hypothetical protein
VSRDREAATPYFERNPIPMTHEIVMADQMIDGPQPFEKQPYPRQFDAYHDILSNRTYFTLSLPFIHDFTTPGFRYDFGWLGRLPCGRPSDAEDSPRNTDRCG